MRSTCLCDVMTSNILAHLLLLPSRSGRLSSICCAVRCRVCCCRLPLDHDVYLQQPDSGVAAAFCDVPWILDHVLPNGSRGFVDSCADSRPRVCRSTHVGKIWSCVRGMDTLWWIFCCRDTRDKFLKRWIVHVCYCAKEGVNSFKNKPPFFYFRLKLKQNTDFTRPLAILQYYS